NRLKREGLHSAHIGISIQDDDKAQRGAVPVLHECWQALETAERRGIFSLCEGSYLADRESHPLALPPHQVVSILRRKWRGARQFGLIRLSIEDVPAETFEEFEFDKTVAGTLPEGVSFTSVSSREGYILAPDLPAEKILSLGKRIKKKVESEHKTVSVALGVSHWPLLNYTKTQSVVNCIKALMHGRFFGSGSVTVFDHVSLNVSGDYFFDEGDYRQAVRDYRTGVLLAPDDINLLNSLGVALTALNRLREAVVYFDRVLAIDSGDFMALVNMGFAHRILGNEDKAIRCFEKASRHTEFADSPVFDELSLQLARLYCDKEIYDSALELLKRLDRSQNGRQGYSLFLLQGEACAGIGQHKEAVSFLQKAVRINPHDPHALSLLGELYALDEQGDEIALSLCQKAVSIDDASWKHWYRLALVQLRMGRLEEAREAVQESLRINRKAVEALSLAEQIYMQLGVLSKARSMHNRLLKIARTDHKAVKAMLN
ncbi:MAG: tetratricopeptide repeat protein, partial [Desulfobulbaceae bacterium]|nr:tetratricopeptide repeat protein [Desulfobulbaceae bacterium]